MSGKDTEFMPDQNRIVKPGFKIGTVITEENKVLSPPADWEFLPAGDAPLTRNVKKMGPTWQVQVQKGRRKISKGVWAPAAYIRLAKEALEAKRATPEYARKRATEQKRKQRKHNQYVEDFYAETLKFLNFHPDYQEYAEKLARAVAEHATPVGSRTVARTERIPLAARVQAAVIAWMRHQTTSYDRMAIARIKGRRREVRRMLAERSVQLLSRYRSGLPVDESCPLYKALIKSDAL